MWLGKRRVVNHSGRSCHNCGVRVKPADVCQCKFEEKGLLFYLPEYRTLYIAAQINSLSLAYFKELVNGPHVKLHLTWHPLSGLENDEF